MDVITATRRQRQQTSIISRGTSGSLLTAMACLLGFAAGCGSSDDANVADNSAASQTTAAQGEPAANEAAEPARPMPGGETGDLESVVADGEKTGDSVDELAKRAEQLLQAGDVVGAVRALTQAIGKNPRSPDVYVKRARILSQAGLHTRAIADVTKAIELNPDDARLRNTRGFYFLSQQKHDRAVQDFNDAIAIDLNYPHPYNNRGLLRIAQGDYDTAVADFDAALRIDPEYRDALNNRGLALVRLERYAEAAESFSAAIEISPEFPGSWNNRALANHKLGENEAAVRDLTQAIKLKPDQSKYYLQRSEALEALGRTAEAEADLNYAVWLQQVAAINLKISASPGDPGLWVRRGQLHLTIDRPASLNRARADFVHALQLDPDCATAFSGLAAIHLREGNVEQAIHNCTQAIERQPHHTAYSLRGDAYLEQGEFDLAIEDFTAARRLDETVARAYLLRSEQHQAAGNIQQASADRERAVELDPSLDPDAPPREKPKPQAAPAFPDEAVDVTESGEPE